MAADSKIMIDLELRKDQAEARLRQFEQRAAQQLEKLQKVQAKYDANPTAFVRNQLNASRAAYGRRLSDMQGAGRDIRNLEMKIDQESARKGGKLFGMAVNKQTEQFVKQFVGAYVAREAMNIGFSAMYTPLGNNAGVRKAQGAAEGATTGAQIGMAFGPWGAAIGTAVGALAGFTSALIKDKKEIEAAQVSRHNDRQMQRFEVGRAVQNNAFDRSLSMHARPAQIAKLQKRIDQLNNGNGQFSIKSLEAKLKQMEHDDGDYESARHKAVEQMLSRALNEKTRLQEQLFQTATQPYYQFRDVGQYADSRAKQGLYSGHATLGKMIDSPLAKVQNAMARAGLEPSTLSSAHLSKWVDYAGKMQTKGKGDKGREAFEAAIERQTGAKVDLKGIDFNSQRKIPINGIDFKELNNPVVNELKRIRSRLEAIASTADKNANDDNASGKWSRNHIQFGF